MHRQEVFLPFRSHPRFCELLENIFTVGILPISPFCYLKTFIPLHYLALVPWGEFWFARFVILHLWSFPLSWQILIAWQKWADLPNCCLVLHVLWKNSHLLTVVLGRNFVSLTSLEVSWRSLQCSKLWLYLVNIYQYFGFLLTAGRNSASFQSLKVSWLTGSFLNIGNILIRLTSILVWGGSNHNFNIWRGWIIFERKCPIVEPRYISGYWFLTAGWS